MAEEINVVIVEDEEEEAERIRKWLGLESEEVSVFDPTEHLQGSDAQQYEPVLKHLLRELKRSNPRVIVLDLYLHDYANFNGQGLCRELRDRCPSLGLICVTTRPSNQDVCSFSKWGANHGWTKPWQGCGDAPKPGSEAIVTRDLIQDSARAKDCCNLQEPF